MDDSDSDANPKLTQYFNSIRIYPRHDLFTRRL